MGKKRQQPIDNFMSHIERITESGCWIWTASVHSQTGYPRFVSGKHIYAHRFSYTHFNGEIPEGYYVCHKCDIPTCVNPNHLFVGTATDNMQDASRKNRIKMPKASFASSELHQVAILTDAQVREIRASDIASKVFAKMFGVSYRTIWAARTRRTFRDVA